MQDTHSHFSANVFVSKYFMPPLYISLKCNVVLLFKVHISSLYMSYICENCSTFLLGGFLGPSELFAYWRPASFIIKVSWIKVLFLNVSYILKTNKGLWCISTFIFLWLPGKDCSNAGAKMLSLLNHPYPPFSPFGEKKLFTLSSQQHFSHF